MSSTSGVSVPVYQAPTFNESSSVVSKIEDEVGNINTLFDDVQQLLQELQALKPPDASSFKDASGKPDPAAFSKAMADFQKQVADLNVRLETVYRKLGVAQVLLAKLQNTDLPAADQRDAERLQKAAKEATEALDAAAKALADSSKTPEESGPSKGATDARVEINLRTKKLELKLANDPSFKEVINAFQLMVVVVGQTELDRKFTKVPPAAGGGLPPIGTP